MVTVAARAWDLLKQSDLAVDDGLTNKEIAAIERRNHFEFAVDHREFLSLAVPISDGWPNWRTLSDADIRDWMQSPIDGVVFDVHNNDFWPRSWGRRPNRSSARERVARKKLNLVPRLAPIFGHRFAPAILGLAGAPVFSVHQTDVVYYGSDLADWARNELRPPHVMSERKRLEILAFVDALQRGDKPTPVEPDPGEWTGVPFADALKIDFWSNLAEEDSAFVRHEFGVGRAFNNN